METEEEKKLLVKFPEDSSPSNNTLVVTTPNNSVDKAADFLPRALVAIKEYFKESAFLFIVVGYIFIAAFGHMEKLENYVGYFFVILFSIFMYKIWDLIKLKDILYIVIIMGLLFYLLSIKLDISVLSWF